MSSLPVITAVSMPVGVYSPEQGSILLRHFNIPIKVWLVWERGGKAPSRLTLGRDCFLERPTLRACFSFGGSRCTA